MCAKSGLNRCPRCTYYHSNSPLPHESCQSSKLLKQRIKNKKQSFILGPTTLSPYRTCLTTTQHPTPNKTTNNHPKPPAQSTTILGNVDNERIHRHRNHSHDPRPTPRSPNMLGLLGIRKVRRADEALDAAPSSPRASTATRGSRAARAGLVYRRRGCGLTR